MSDAIAPSRESRRDDEHGIDLAPMLDFVLNLLIFFIITTSFVSEAGIDGEPARGADGGATPRAATS